MLLSAIFALAVISTQDLQRELPVSRGDEVIVADAISRFAKKLRADDDVVSENWVPIVAHMPPKRCVLLKMRPAGLGESPVYCYDQSGNFLEVFENPHF